YSAAMREAVDNQPLERIRAHKPPFGCAVVNVGCERGRAGAGNSGRAGAGAGARACCRALIDVPIDVDNVGEAKGRTNRPGFARAIVVPGRVGIIAVIHDAPAMHRAGRAAADEHALRSEHKAEGYIELCLAAVVEPYAVKAVV